jgi:hypothetical protein
MKYITTDKHPELKKGIVFQKRLQNRNYYSPTGFVAIESEDIIASVSNGFIKELQEPEFTKDDMIDFVHWAVINYSEPYYNITMARSDFNK